MASKAVSTFIQLTVQGLTEGPFWDQIGDQADNVTCINDGHSWYASYTVCNTCRDYLLSGSVGLLRVTLPFQYLDVCLTRCSLLRYPISSQDPALFGCVLVQPPESAKNESGVIIAKGGQHLIADAH